MVSSDGTSRLYQKQFRYDPTNHGSSIITIFENLLSLMDDKPGQVPSNATANGYLRVLNCNHKIAASSLPEIQMPDYLDEDTPSQRLSKSKSVIWDAPAYRLILYLAHKGGDWVEFPFYNLSKTYGFPYTSTNILRGLTSDLARDVSEGGKVGIAFEDIGWGLPKTVDSITFDAVVKVDYEWTNPYSISISQPVVVQTATVQQVVQKSDSYTNTRVGTTAVQLMGSNDARLSGQIKNNSSVIIYYGLGSTPSTSVNSGAVQPNAVVNLPAGNKTYVSVIAASGLTNSVTCTEVYNVTA